MTVSFVSEFALNMMSTASVLLQPEHLGRIKAMGFDADFHIYFIGSRPRISVDPASFEFLARSFRGVFLVHRQGETEAIPFEIGQPPEAPPITRIESEWPHTQFALADDKDGRLETKAAIFASIVPKMRKHLDIEVLYIGQAFGDGGERVAADRLESHGTLQKILAEASRLQPDREIWLSLFAFEEILLARFDGHLANTPGALEADEGRIERALSQEVSLAHRINYTEAALIRFFGPKFNRNFRDRFPDVTHTSYKECYELDLNMVCVELNTEDLHARFYSSSQAPAWTHFLMFPLNGPKERKSMLDLAVAGTGQREPIEPTEG